MVYLFPSVALEQRALHAPLLEAFVHALGDGLGIARLRSVHDGNPGQRKRDGGRELESVKKRCGADAVSCVSVTSDAVCGASALP